MACRTENTAFSVHRVETKNNYIWNDIVIWPKIIVSFGPIKTYGGSRRFYLLLNSLPGVFHSLEPLNTLSTGYSLGRPCI